MTSALLRNPPDITASTSPRSASNASPAERQRRGSPGAAEPNAACTRESSSGRQTPADEECEAALSRGPALLSSHAQPSTGCADRLICTGTALATAATRRRSQSPRSKRVRPGLGTTAFVLGPGCAGLLQKRHSDGADHPPEARHPQSRRPGSAYADPGICAVRSPPLTATWRNRGPAERSLRSATERVRYGCGRDPAGDACDRHSRVPRRSRPARNPALGAGSL
jgi:hypothetical protein